MLVWAPGRGGFALTQRAPLPVRRRHQGGHAAQLLPGRQQISAGVGRLDGERGRVAADFDGAQHAGLAVRLDDLEIASKRHRGREELGCVGGLDGFVGARRPKILRKQESGVSGSRTRHSGEQRRRDQNSFHRLHS